MNLDITRYLTLAVVIGPVCLLTYSLHVANKPFFATSIAATLLMAAYALSWPAATRSLSTCVVAGIAALGLGSLLTLQVSWRLDKMLWTATARS